MGVRRGVGGTTALLTVLGAVWGAFSLPAEPQPVVSAITPNTGHRGVNLAITNLAGSNFVATPTVKLRKLPGSPSPWWHYIDATNVALVSSSELTCRFCLAGAELGAWDVVVTNPDSQSGSLNEGFTVLDETIAPTTVYVDDGWTDPGYIPGHEWGYDAFSRIMDGIDHVASPAARSSCSPARTSSLTTAPRASPSGRPIRPTRTWSASQQSGETATVRWSASPEAKRGERNYWG